MKSECVGLLGRIFGHKYVPVITRSAVRLNSLEARGNQEAVNAWLDNYRDQTFSGCVCQRCGDIKGAR